MDFSFSSDHAASLRRSIRDAQTIGPASEILLNSLHASLAHGGPDLVQVWDEETSPVQASLDLHLEGSGVKNHMTRVDQLALFVAGINDAVKAVVRENTGRQRLHRNLLVEGVQPGSVRVSLRADAPLPAQGTPHDAPLAGLERFASSPDSAALRLVARLFTEASDETPEIDGDVSVLPMRARQGLAKALRAAEKADWEIEGDLSQRGLGKSRVELSRRGIKALNLSLEAHEYTTKLEYIVGTIDGFRRSMGRLYLAPSGGGQPLTISVQSDALIREVAVLATEPERPVLANIETVSVLDPGQEGRAAGRILVSIGPADQTQPLDGMQLR